jgi:hypothetical protein
MDCQLQNLPEAGSEPTRGERLRARARRGLSDLGGRAGRALRDPRLLLEKAHLVARRERPGFRGGPDPVIPSPLGLREGERVRVKAMEQIRATLDPVGDCQGLGFMPIQAGFCGREFTVAKRVERFFDERTRRMLRIRNTVILDGVYCEPPADGPDDYSGCHRTCFLFWKEAWLERV